jgi:putative tryptophan/tyrosine transport system substrate-binding protein
MQRREFIILLGGAAAGWPLTARAQQPDQIKRLALLTPYAESDPEGQARLAALREGLGKLGWAEGRNIRIDNRWGAIGAESLQRFAKELVAQQPDLILTQSTPTTIAILQQTRTIPVLFVQVTDPVGQGIVGSFGWKSGHCGATLEAH